MYTNPNPFHTSGMSSQPRKHHRSPDMVNMGTYNNESEPHHSGYLHKRLKTHSSTVVNGNTESVLASTHQSELQPSIHTLGTTSSQVSGTPSIACYNTILNTDSIWAQSDQLGGSVHAGGGGSHACFPLYTMNDDSSRAISNVSSITTEYILSHANSYPSQTTVVPNVLTSGNLMGHANMDATGNSSSITYEYDPQSQPTQTSKKHTHISPATPTADLKSFPPTQGIKYLSPLSLQLASLPNTTSSESMMDVTSSSILAVSHNPNNSNTISNNSHTNNTSNMSNKNNVNNIQPFAYDTLHGNNNHINMPQHLIHNNNNTSSSNNNNTNNMNNTDGSYDHPDYTYLPTLLPNFAYSNNAATVNTTHNPNMTSAINNNNNNNNIPSNNNHVGMSTRSDHLNYRKSANNVNNTQYQQQSALAQQQQQQQFLQQQQQQFLQQQQLQAQQQQQQHSNGIVCSASMNNNIAYDANTNNSEYYGDQLKRRSKLPLNAVLGLRQWLRNNICTPYPSSVEKQQLALAQQLQQSQVHNWLSNVRKRCLAPWLKSIGITLQPFKPLSQTDAQYVLKKIEEIPEDRYLGPI